METQYAAAIGAVFGVAITAAVNFLGNRQALQQRKREQVLALAYDAAMSEYKAALEIGPKLHPSGNFVAAPYTTYLVYHLCIARRLIEGNDVIGLDDKAIAHALDEAKRLALTTWNPKDATGEQT